MPAKGCPTGVILLCNSNTIFLRGALHKRVSVSILFFLRTLYYPDWLIQHVHLKRVTSSMHTFTQDKVLFVLYSEGKSPTICELSLN